MGNDLGVRRALRRHPEPVEGWHLNIAKKNPRAGGGQKRRGGNIDDTTAKNIHKPAEFSRRSLLLV